LSRWCRSIDDFSFGRLAPGQRDELHEALLMHQRRLGLGRHEGVGHHRGEEQLGVSLERELALGLRERRPRRRYARSSRACRRTRP
jgi:hypothetical protein